MGEISVKDTAAFLNGANVSPHGDLTWFRDVEREIGLECACVVGRSTLPWAPIVLNVTDAHIFRRSCLIMEKNGGSNFMDPFANHLSERTLSGFFDLL